MFVSIGVGRYHISINDIIKFLFNSKELEKTKLNIIIYLRIPRIIIAILVGSSLAIAGTVYQSTFKNKLVSPDILGVSSGSCVGAALGIILGFNILICSFLSFITGIMAVLFTLAIQKIIRNKSSLSLVLSGIIVSALMNSCLGLIKFLADTENQLAAITFWTMGDLSSSTYLNIIYILPIVFPCVTIILLIRWKINVVSIGQSQSQTLGLNYKFYRMIIIVCSTLLTAASVSVCGTIGWIGLVIPHIVRIIVGNDNRKVIPLCITFGASFLVIVDMFARSLSFNEIPISIITGFLGAIIYLVLLCYNSKEVCR